MNDILTWPFIIGVLVVWGFGSLLLKTILPAHVAIVIAGFKILISAAYFLFFYNGGWYVGGDDEAYYQAGVALATSGHNLIGIWSTPLGQYLLLERETLLLIHYWNMAWMVLLESKYYAPVFGHVLLSMLSGVCFFFILRAFNFSKFFCQGAVIFFLLHWTMITWTSFLNIREPLVLAASAIFLVCLTNLYHKRYLAAVPLMIVFYVFGFLRFYMPILLLSGFCIGYVLFHLDNYRKVLLRAALTLIGVGLFLWIYFLGEVRMLLHEQLVFSPSSFIKGLLKQFLSPLPWQITSESRYQFLGSILHLMFLPIALFGAVFAVVSKSRLVFFLGIIVVMFVALALNPMIWTPRHRFVADSLWIFFQYFGLYSIFRILKPVRLDPHTKDYFA